MSNADNPLPVETDDDAVLRMFGGANLGPNFRLTLPSGTVLPGDEVQVFSSVFRDKSQEPKLSSKLHNVLDRPVITPDLSNPLSSANDRWTGDPDIDRQLLVQRAMEAMDRIVPPAYPLKNEMQRTPSRPSLLVRIIRRLRRR